MEISLLCLQKLLFRSSLGRRVEKLATAPPGTLGGLLILFVQSLMIHSVVSIAFSIAVGELLDKKVCDNESELIKEIITRNCVWGEFWCWKGDSIAHLVMRAVCDSLIDSAWMEKEKFSMRIKFKSLFMRIQLKVRMTVLVHQDLICRLHRLPVCWINETCVSVCSKLRVVHRTAMTPN